jgi:hypothetical protein
MTADTSVLGSLHSVDGEGVVRMEDRFDTGIDDLWGALTDPDRLARWYGDRKERVVATRTQRARPAACERAAPGGVPLLPPPSNRATLETATAAKARLVRSLDPGSQHPRVRPAPPPAHKPWSLPHDRRSRLWAHPVRGLVG